MVNMRWWRKDDLDVTTGVHRAGLTPEQQAARRQQRSEDFRRAGEEGPSRSGAHRANDPDAPIFRAAGKVLDEAAKHVEPHSPTAAAVTKTAGTLATGHADRLDRDQAKTLEETRRLRDDHHRRVGAAAELDRAREQRAPQIRNEPPPRSIER